MLRRLLFLPFLRSRPAGWRVQRGERLVVKQGASSSGSRAKAPRFPEEASCRRHGNEAVVMHAADGYQREGSLKVIMAALLFMAQRACRTHYFWRRMRREAPKFARGASKAVFSRLCRATVLVVEESEPFASVAT